MHPARRMGLELVTRAAVALGTGQGLVVPCAAMAANRSGSRGSAGGGRIAWCSLASPIPTMIMKGYLGLGPQ
jgi:hypothetical protein